MTAVVDAASVPYLAGARDAVAAGYASGGTQRNLAWVEPHTRFAETIGELLPRGEYPIEVR